MSFNEDVDRLTHRHRFHWLTWAITLFIVLVCLFFCWPSHATPPVIGDVPRWNSPLPEALEDASETVPVIEAPSRIQPADGPMCLPLSEIEPPRATHFGLLVSEPATESERAEIYQQVDKCWRFNGVKNHWTASKLLPQPPDPWKLLALFRLEEDLGIPEEYRGILGAAWCWESAFRSEPRSGDAGASHGPFQQQDWFWAWCGAYGPTFDIINAAQCYWSRADYYLRDGKCPGNILRAEAMAANGKAYKNWGCSAVSLHGKELKRWQTSKTSPK